jgi:Transposase IS66 family
VYHRIFDSRSAVTAKEVLGEYHGSVVADGYEPYQIVARAGPDGVPRYTLAFCWAHYLESGVIWSGPTCPLPPALRQPAFDAGLGQVDSRNKRHFLLAESHPQNV